MRTALFAFAAIAFVATPAFAQQLNTDDMKWINQCIRDNKGAAADEVGEDLPLLLPRQVGAGRGRRQIELRGVA